MHSDSIRLARLIRMVTEAQRSRAPIQRLAAVVSTGFVLVVVLIAIATSSVWMSVGPQPCFAHALLAAVFILIIGSPCALCLTTTTALAVQPRGR
jgi:Cu+-exporting ATPase